MSIKNIMQMLGTAIFMALFITCDNHNQQKSDIDMSELVVRMAEIEVYPAYLEEYYAILKEESKASLKNESGVISIFPMYQKEYPNRIRLLEIYSSESSYQSHLKTPHFLLYKTTTVHMVKSLKLIDMNPIDEESIVDIFEKLPIDSE